MKPAVASPLALSVLALQIAGSAAAQDRLVVTSQQQQPLQTEVGAMARFGQPLGPRPAWVTSDVVAGGRYFVVTRGTLGGFGLPFVPAVIVETATARQFSATGMAVAVDPLRPRLFAFTGTALVVEDIERGTVTPLMNPAAFADVWNSQYAATADELFVRAASGDITVLNGTTGAVKRHLHDLGLPVPFLRWSLFSDWLASPAGDRLLVVSEDGATLRVVNGQTGDILASAPLMPGGGGALMPDPLGGRVFVVQGWYGRWSLTAVSTTGVPLGSAPISGYCPPVVRASPHTGRVYLMSYAGGAGKYYGPIIQNLSVFDGATLQRLGEVTIDDTLDLCSGSFQLITPPGAPGDPTVLVAAHDVTLSWTNDGTATDFVLDAGTAPGQTALTLPLGAGTSTTLTGVPSGRYYARVRGGNLFGSSPPSRELTIVVR